MKPSNEEPRKGIFATEKKRLVLLLPEMVALDPDILLRERRSPVLFKVAFAACKITGFGSDCNRSVDGVIHADDAVVTFHVRDVGEETHDGWRHRCAFDRLEWPQFQDAFYPEIILFQMHTDERFRKDAVADFQHKGTFGCIETQTMDSGCSRSAALFRALLRHGHRNIG